jgi:signal transduction histidine kinase
VTPVPIVTADDFGRLAYSFNSMLGTLTRHRAELRASHARIVIAGDEARRGVERDLHDGAQQRLVHLHLKLAMAAESVRRDAGTTERLLLEMQQEMVAAISELRELAHGVFPPMLEEGGLVEALADVVERSPIPVTLDGADVRRLAPELEAGVYFSCLEALQNAAKHAGDDVHVVLALGERDGWLRWEVTDDGTGFDDTAALHRGGLLNMADRMRALDGELTISSLPGSGTTITGAVPIQVRRG